MTSKLQQQLMYQQQQEAPTGAGQAAAAAAGNSSNDGSSAELAGSRSAAAAAAAAGSSVTEHGWPCFSLFVHMPSFEVVNQARQREFVVHLLDLVARGCCLGACLMYIVYCSSFAAPHVCMRHLPWIYNHCMCY
jgi:hypothetical protein